MTNPYEAFNISDDEQEQFVGAAKTDKARKTHKERRQLKKTGQPEPTKATTEVVNTEVPVRVRDNAKEVRHNRQGRPNKEVPEGHTLDRRSGTGRDDRYPRKGRGNVGNLEDQLHKEKFEKPEQVATTTTPVEQTTEAPKEQQKTEEPQKLTLAEYYQSKGIDINSIGGQKKTQVKGEVNAEWLKKEKLTLLETKQDKKKQENVKQNILQHNNTKVELDLGNPEILGFGIKPAQKPREQEHERPYHGKEHKGKKTQPKVVLKEEDFPSL